LSRIAGSFCWLCRETRWFFEGVFFPKEKKLELIGGSFDSDDFLILIFLKIVINS
jgi:hypothetical protein